MHPREAREAAAFFSERGCGPCRAVSLPDASSLRAVGGAVIDGSALLSVGSPTWHTTWCPSAPRYSASLVRALPYCDHAAEGGSPQFSAYGKKKVPRRSEICLRIRAGMTTTTGSKHSQESFVFRMSVVAIRLLGQTYVQDRSRCCVFG